MNINVSIERLILEGLPVSSNQGHAIAAAMKTELTRLLTIEGLAASASRAESHLAPAQIHVVPDGGPRSIGQQIGDAVYHVLNQSTQTTANQKANIP
jgi:hypothetical protein